VTPHRLLARLGLLLAPLLAGCAGVAPPAREAPLSYPPETRERLLRLALGEWAEWGCLVRGLPGPSLAIGCAAQREANPEGAAENFSRILAYWRAVPQQDEAIPPNRARYRQTLAGENAGLWAEPYWSAAFISWLIVAAGVDRVEFAPDASHARYLDHLDMVAAAFPQLAPFLPRDPASYAPAPGDLACFDRSARPLAQWAARAAERGQFRPMHCDLVVAAGPGVVEVVGGNVADAVTLTRLAADPSGVLLPDERRMIVIMQNRLGRLPPFANRPTA
jgi:hypothetical protein